MFPKEPFYGRERGILIAECLNRVGSASECLEFCAKWKSSLKSEVRFLRVEAETIADFYFVGMQTKDGNRVVVPECVSFFTEVIKDSAKRQLSDFRIPVANQGVARRSCCGLVYCESVA